MLQMIITRGQAQTCCDAHACRPVKLTGAGLQPYVHTPRGRAPSHECGAHARGIPGDLPESDWAHRLSNYSGLNPTQVYKELTEGTSLTFSKKDSFVPLKRSSREREVIPRPSVRSAS